MSCRSTSHPPHQRSPRRQRWKKRTEMKKAVVAARFLILTVLLKRLTLDNNKTHLKLELNTDKRRQRLSGELMPGHSSSRFQPNYVRRETRYPASPSARPPGSGRVRLYSKQSTQKKGGNWIISTAFFSYTLSKI